MAPRAPWVMRWQAAWALRRELGRRRAASVLALADQRFSPPPGLARTSAGRFNLEMAAYLLALRDGLTLSGYESGAANRLLARSLYRVMRRFYAPMDAFAAVAHPKNRLSRARRRQRLSRRIFFRSPDWLMEETRQTEGYGFDVRRCVLAEYMQNRGELQFCRDVFCAQDLLMAEGRAELLTRTQMIAAGDERCDFRFSAPRRGRSAA